MTQIERGGRGSVDAGPLVGQGPGGKIVELSIGDPVMQKTGLDRLPPWAQILLWLGGAAVTTGGALAVVDYYIRLTTPMIK